MKNIERTRGDVREAFEKQHDLDALTDVEYISFSTFLHQHFQPPFSLEELNLSLKTILESLSQPKLESTVSPEQLRRAPYREGDLGLARPKQARSLPLDSPAMQIYQQKLAQEKIALEIDRREHPEKYGNGFYRNGIWIPDGESQRDVSRDRFIQGMKQAAVQQRKNKFAR